MRRLTTGLLVGGFAAASALTAGAAVAAPATTTAPAVSGVAAKASSYQPPPIDFGPCDNPRLQAAGAECGFVVVPLDYAKPSGEKIKIAVSRIMHKTSDAKAQGIMLVNPGGPGGSGLTLSRLGGFVPNGGGDPYDWIGFDPRGVGSSEPSLACDGNYFPTNRPDYVPARPSLEAYWLDKSEGYADKCADQGEALVGDGSLLDHLKTRDNVEDMDSIRKALGKKRINYYGFSYGTYLGQVYATTYPTHLRRAVFDGVVDPRNVWYEANLDQDLAFEKTENIFFAWVASHNDVYGLGSTGPAVRAKWDELLDDSRDAPFDGQIGPDEWTDSFLSAGYYVYDWDVIANAFKQAAAGNYAPVEELYAGANGSGPGSDNGFAIYLGTQCTDLPWPSDWAKVRRDNWTTYADAPFETWANAWFNGPCSFWQGQADKVKPKVDGADAPPILLIEETFDAATPYPGAIEVRSRFPRSSLIQGKNGSTHAGSLSGVACTDDKVANYLLTGRLPARVAGNRADVNCDPVPPPDATTGGKHATGGMPADLRAVITGAQR